MLSLICNPLKITIRKHHLLCFMCIVIVIIIIIIKNYKPSYVEKTKNCNYLLVVNILLITVMIDSVVRAYVSRNQCNPVIDIHSIIEFYK